MVASCATRDCSGALMTSFNTEWRNDGAAGVCFPRHAWQVAGLSPALGARIFSLIGSAALRCHNCGATECQGAVVPPSPAVESPRANHPVINGAPFPAAALGAAPSDPPSTLFQIQQALFTAMLFGLLSVARARAFWGAGSGFFMCGFGHAVHDQNFCQFQSHNATQQI